VGAGRGYPRPTAIGKSDRPLPVELDNARRRGNPARAPGKGIAMTVQSIMTTDLVTLQADDTVGKAADLMLAKRYILLAVIDADRRYLGEFDLWDLLGLLLPKAAVLTELMPDLSFMGDDLPALQSKFAALRDSPVGPLSKTNLPHLAPDTPVIEALLKFHRHRSTLPVVDPETGRLLGVLSYWDALAAVTHGK
jgi:CBS-domain-containing membrane protein